MINSKLMLQVEATLQTVLKMTTLKDPFKQNF